mgnify:CR=1 FL=1
MKVLIFTHKNDIDGMGNAVLANLAFDQVDYVLCGTFDLTKSVLKYYDNGRIYGYDMIYVTDLCLEEPLLSRIDNDPLLNGKILNLDHHKTFDNEKYTKYPFKLKERIAGPTGHLSNKIAGQTINYLINSGLKKAVLGHLSKESNFPELAYQTVMDEIISSGTNIDGFSLSVAKRDCPGEIIKIS